jgi:hypothetical protein
MDEWQASRMSEPDVVDVETRDGAVNIKLWNKGTIWALEKP